MKIAHIKYKNHLPMLDRKHPYCTNLGGQIDIYCEICYSSCFHIFLCLWIVCSHTGSDFQCFFFLFHFVLFVSFFLLLILICLLQFFWRIYYTIHNLIYLLKFFLHIFDDWMNIWSFIHVLLLATLM